MTRQYSRETGASRFATFVRRSHWRFAKSYPKHPHEYTIREWASDDDVFTEIADFIQQQGEPRSFYRAMFVYFDHDGWTYWTMGADPEETMVINRARIDAGD